MKELRKQTFQHIESELYSYKDTLKEIEELKNNIILSSGSSDGIGGTSNSIVSVTEIKGTALATNKRILHLERISKVIEKVLNEISEDQRKLIELKYFTKPQLNTWEGIAQKIPVSRTQAFVWRNAVILKIAQELGWK